MMRIGLKFAYDGSKFHGYARQPNLRTIEGELIKALIKNGFIPPGTLLLLPPGDANTKK